MQLLLRHIRTFSQSIGQHLSLFTQYTHDIVIALVACWAAIVIRIGRLSSRLEAPKPRLHPYFLFFRWISVIVSGVYWALTAVRIAEYLEHSDVSGQPVLCYNGKLLPDLASAERGPACGPTW